MYTAAAGMAAQQQRLDATANDLANVNTTGYKKLRVAFRDLVYSPTGPGAATGVQEGAGSAATLLGRTSAQGALSAPTVRSTSRSAARATCASRTPGASRSSPATARCRSTTRTA
jgi:flagellar basal body rod protein FlgG